MSSGHFFGVPRTMRSQWLEAIPDHRVLHSNSLAIVTPEWVIVRSSRLSGQSMIALGSIREMRRVKTSYPGLLVIAAALFLIAAAAYSSKQGDGAAIPMAVLGAVFSLLYAGSRRATVVFYLDGEQVESAPGGLREASALISAVRNAQESQRAECGVIPLET